MVVQSRHLWGEWAGTNPTDRGKLGTKGHTLVDGRRVPLSSIVTEANKYDMKLAFPTIGSIIVEGPKVEQHICMDERYDFPEIKKGERRSGYVDLIRHKG